MTTRRIVPIAVDGLGQRKRDVEISALAIRNLYAESVPLMQPEQRRALLRADLPEIVRRDLAFRGHLSESTYNLFTIACLIEFETSSGETVGEHVSSCR